MYRVLSTGYFPKCVPYSVSTPIIATIILLISIIPLAINNLQSVNTSNSSYDLFSGFKTYTMNDIAGNEEQFLGKPIKLKAVLTRSEDCPVQKIINEGYAPCSISCSFYTKIDNIENEVVVEADKEYNGNIRFSTYGKMSWCGYEKTEKVQNIEYVMNGYLAKDSNSNYVFKVKDLTPELSSLDSSINQGNTASLFELIRRQSDRLGETSSILLTINPGERIEVEEVMKVIYNYERRTTYDTKLPAEKTLCILAKKDRQENSKFINVEGAWVKYFGDSPNKITVTGVCVESKNKLLLTLKENNITTDFSERSNKCIGLSDQSNNSYCLVIIGGNGNENN